MNCEARSGFEIHHVKTPLANSYVVNQDGRLLVIDVGVGCHEYVLGFIEQELASSREAVEMIVCTHDDIDHLGGVRHLALACNSPFALPYASRSRRKKYWNNPSGWLLRLGTGIVEGARPRSWRMYLSPRRRRRVRRRPRSRVALAPLKVARLRPTSRLKDGDPVGSFSEWTVVHTPGHTWDSCCYYHQPSASLISGDTVLGSTAKSRLVLPAILSSRSQMRQSIETLRELEVRHVYPGHGAVIRGDDPLESVSGGAVQGSRSRAQG